MLSLFDDVNPVEQLEEIKNYLRQEWIDYLDANKLLEASMIMKRVEDASVDQGFTYWPDKKDTFRAFNLTPPKEIKAVIVSICPYPNSNADGVAFSCAHSPSQSLRQLYHGIIDDPNLVEKEQFNYPLQLDHWCKQGVLMINARLQVKDGDSKSLSTVGWQEFIGYVCQTISRRNYNIPFLLLGAEARKPVITQHLHDRTLVIQCDHPVNASRNNSYWTCNGFETINEHLINNNQTPIKWI